VTNAIETYLGAGPRSGDFAHFRVVILVRLIMLPTVELYLSAQFARITTTNRMNIILLKNQQKAWC
jgi:hypothetical protein